MLPLQQLVPEQLPSLQVSLPHPPPKASKGPSKASGRGVEVAKGKEAGLGKAQPESKIKDKEAKTLPETQGLEAAPKAKDATPKAKETTSKAADPHVSQPANKEDPSPAKAQLRTFSFNVPFLLLWQLAIIYNIFFFCSMKRHQLLLLWTFVFLAIFVSGWLQLLFCSLLRLQIDDASKGGHPYFNKS